MSLHKDIIRALRIWLLRRCGIWLADYRNNTLRKDKELLGLLLGIARENRTLQLPEELYNIHRLAECTGHLDGEIAEVGVYRGGSAKLIAMRKGSRELHLFDSFEGMLATSEGTDIHAVGDFSDNCLADVRRYLAEFDNVFFHKGWFPGSARGLEGKLFCLVHLDVDLYKSTLDALEFFYGRMVRGGIIVSHDYSSLSCPGVSRAFDEFFSDKDETVVVLGGTTQCMVVKLC